MVVAAASLVGALLLTRIRPARGSTLAALWPGDASSASALLQVLSTAVMTATALTFSVTVVALQLASQQFSPRLLREFSRDPVTKAVLAVLAATFVFSTTTLSAVPDDEAGPALAVLVAFTLGIVSLGAILAYVAHIVRVIRVDTMMVLVHDETIRAIDAFYPPYGEGSDEWAHDLSESVRVHADRSGFVQRLDVARIVAAAAESDVLVRVDVRAGDHVVRGTPIAAVRRAGAAGSDRVSEDFVAALRRASTSATSGRSTRTPVSGSGSWRTSP